MQKLIDVARRAIQRVASEPAAVLAAAVAAVNATTVQTWEGYAVAVAVALLRFVVSPVIDFRED